MARYDDCLKLILQFEGGYSNDHFDPGGATCDGIEQTEYDIYRRAKGLSSRTVANIATAEASDIYHSYYWVPAHCDGLAQPLDVVMFDSAVNNGLGTSIKWLQTALGCPVTGDFDNDTSAAYHAYANAHGALPLAQAVLRQRVARYHELPKINPRLSKFLNGWLNRVAALMKWSGISTL